MHLEKLENEEIEKVKIILTILYTRAFVGLDFKMVIVERGKYICDTNNLVRHCTNKESQKTDNTIPLYFLWGSSDDYIFALLVKICLHT